MSLFRIRSGKRQGARDEGERPFWISFSDLMSALMVLFLVALTVALMAITHDIRETERQKDEQAEDIARLLQQLQSQIEQFPGVRLRGSVIDFGDRARFDLNSHRLNPSQEALLRRFAPVILALARDPLGEKWLKQVVVEGFADASGSYLHNLDLSQKRSQRVLCALLLPGDGEAALGAADRQSVRELFRVSGASYNALKSSAEESRRIELRLEFRSPDEAPAARPAPPLDNDLRCPLDR